MRKLGLEGARGGRLLLLLHQPHVGHQVPPPSSCWTIFIHNNHFQSRDFFIKTLDDSASGIQAIMARLADRLVPVGQNRMQISSSPNPCFTHQPTRLREVDQVSADILNEQVFRMNTKSSCHQTEVSLRCWANFLRHLTEVSLRCRESRCSILLFAGSPFSSPRLHQSYKGITKRVDWWFYFFGCRSFLFPMSSASGTLSSQTRPGKPHKVKLQNIFSSILRSDLLIQTCAAMVFLVIIFS